MRVDDLVSISPTFYSTSRSQQIPKAQKKTVKLRSFIVLLGSVGVKDARRMLVKLTPDPWGSIMGSYPGVTDNLNGKTDHINNKGSAGHAKYYIF